MRHVTHLKESCHTVGAASAAQGGDDGSKTTRLRSSSAASDTPPRKKSALENSRCNALQRTATYCSTLQHIATHYDLSSQQLRRQ